MYYTTISKEAKALPFYNCSPFTISQMYQTPGNKVLEKLEANNFNKNMLKHVNGFSKNNYTCGYFQEDSILNLSKKHLQDCLKVFHLNIDSFNKNGTELSFYLKSLKNKFDIICLTEIRQTTIGIIDKDFPDYNIFIDNPTMAKGGVAILLRKDKFENITELDSKANFNLKNHCTCNLCQIENKWLSFKINNQEVIIGGIYRHPKGKVDHFNTALDSILNQIKNDTLAIILGDININLMDEENDNTNSYLNNLFAKNFIPCITLPTRITDHSATIIDHIFIKSNKKLIQNKCSSGNLVTDLSDHLPNFTFLDIKTPSIKNRPFIRLFTPKRIKLFTDNLNLEAALINDNELTEVDNSYEKFSTNYFNLYNKYFPYIKMSRKSFKDKPHITKGIKVSIRKKKSYIKNM